jgi:hypothetical protein
MRVSTVGNPYRPTVTRAIAEQMTDVFVERQDTPVLRVRADFKGAGPAEAMRTLEAKLPTLKGRKFYGIYRETASGEEYYACVERIVSDDPGSMQVEEGVIPGGLFVRRKLVDWEKIIADGNLPREAHSLETAYDSDPTRFTIEYYRSHTELHLMVPVKSRGPATTGSPS